MRLGLSRPGLIGVDVRERAVHAVQLAGTGRSRRVHAVAAYPRRPGDTADPAPEAERLAGVLRRQGFEGRSVVLGVPEERLLRAVLELPPRASGAPVDELARAELARTFRIAPGELESGCWDLPRRSCREVSGDVMTVGYPHADATPLLDAFESAGLAVRGLDTRAFALARACAPAEADGGCTALVEIGPTRSTLAIVRGGVPIHERALEEAELDGLRSGVAQRLGVAPAEAERVLAGLGASPADDDPSAPAAGLVGALARRVAQQLQLSLTYLAARYEGVAGGRVLLLGAGACVASLPAHLAAAMEMPVSTFDPSALASVPPGLAEMCGAGAEAAFGLALYPGALAA